MPEKIPEALLWGLRRYLAAPNANVIAMHRQAFGGGLSGSMLEYWRLHLHRAGVQNTITLVHKRGAVVQGKFMQGAPQREALFYTQLASIVPVDCPIIVGVDVPAGDIWMLPFPPAKHATHWLADWRQEDVESTLKDLARLHMSYWDATNTLESWTWLSQPTKADAAAIGSDGIEGLEMLVANHTDTCITPRRAKALYGLARDPSPLLTVLNDGPSTLLHGDAGFQNIALTSDGRQRIWYDWQLASVGPPALDLVTYLHPWAYPDATAPCAIDEMVAIYLRALADRGGVIAGDVFSRQIDAALLWRWILQWAPLLGLYQDRLQPDVRDRLYAAFTQLHWPALERWQAEYGCR